MRDAITKQMEAKKNTQTAAISAYRRAGFATVATERNPMGDGIEYDELIMELPLHP